MDPTHIVELFLIIAETAGRPGGAPHIAACALDGAQAVLALYGDQWFSTEDRSRYHDRIGSAALASALP